MKFLILGILTLAVSSCDAPSGGRARTSRLPASLSTSQVNGTNFSPENSANPTATATSGTTTSEPGFENCNLNSVQTVGTLGGVAICQSTLDETKIKVKFSTADQSVGTCFIPTHKNVDNTSLYIGMAQCTYHTANQILNGTLVKSRSGYANASLNGVMIMKQTSITDYFACMDAVPNFIANNCPGQPTPPACVQQAQLFMQSVCQYFVSRGNYIDKRLKD